MNTSEWRRALMLREMGIQTWMPRAVAASADPAIDGADAEGAAVDGADAMAALAAESSASNASAANPAAAAEPVRHADAALVSAETAIDAAARGARIGAMGWATLDGTVAACEACGLCGTRKQTVFGVGARTARWMLVGEAPGAEEDARGEPFVGQAGRLLDAMLAANGLKRPADLYIANVLKCRPPGNRDPRPEEVAACEPYLMRQLELVNPEVVVVLGRFAAQSLLATDASIARMRGQVHRIEVAGRQVPVIVTYHPAYLLRTLADKSKAWADWCLAADVLAGRHA